jgi:hypothetical protein
MAGIGVFISLRASTVKQAQQAFGIAIIVLTMGPLLTWQALPETMRARFQLWLAELTAERLVAYAVGGLTVISLAVVAAALARFRRGKLVLD